jgi:omega-hydroxy-beta-dihydromenaquinone-9 sulfotransferase
MDSKPRGHQAFSHPLAGSPLGFWLRLLRDGNGVALRCLPQAAFVTLGSLSSSVLRGMETVLYGRRVRDTVIAEPPIFIIGHWRSGTTFLHNLMGEDPNLAFITTFHALAPALYLVGEKTLRPIVQYLVPKTRPQDNMPVLLDAPQEEDIALCNITHHSLNVGLYFPDRMEDLFPKYALLEGLTTREWTEWCDAYLSLLKKATYATGGRRLVLKNPINTGRVKGLLKLFPDAKFIHICRNPYDVFMSTKLKYRRVFSRLALQDVTEEFIHRITINFFREMMPRYIEQRELIPEGNLVEVRFEELEANPVGTVASIYNDLGLPGWDGARPHVEEHVAACRAYKKNDYAISEADAAEVTEQWRFALDEWGYKVS